MSFPALKSICLFFTFIIIDVIAVGIKNIKFVACEICWSIFIKRVSNNINIAPPPIPKLVIIPAIMPGILSGFMMSVTMSMEDYVITSLVSGPGSTTLPIYVYSMIRFGVSPVINALSFVLIIIICAITIILRNGLKSFAASR